MPRNTALLLIDVQEGFRDPYWGKRNNPQAEENIAKLLTAFRSNDRPIFHIQHLSRSSYSPLFPGKTGVEFMEFVQPQLGERIFKKQVNSAFIGTELEKVLHNVKISSLIIVGISTDHCVSTSVRMAANLGFETYLVADATIAFERTGYDGTTYSADDVHAITLASLHQEFATVMNTADVLKMEF